MYFTSTTASEPRSQGCEVSVKRLTTPGPGFRWRLKNLLLSPPHFGPPHGHRAPTSCSRPIPRRRKGASKPTSKPPLTEMGSPAFTMQLFRASAASVRIENSAQYVCKTFNAPRLYSCFIGPGAPVLAVSRISAEILTACEQTSQTNRGAELPPRPRLVSSGIVLAFGLELLTLWLVDHHRPRKQAENRTRTTPRATVSPRGTSIFTPANGRRFRKPTPRCSVTATTPLSSTRRDQRGNCTGSPTNKGAAHA
jgi:hypothetical protein